MRREKVTRGFLWLSVLGWGICLGAKLFDLFVLAGAWGADPPRSLALMPYGSRYPVDPGDFFQPLSALMVIGIVGALASGWKTPIRYKVWLWVPAMAFLLIWIFTPTVFWPMIRDLYGMGLGRIASTDAEAMSVVQRWMRWDWMRVCVIAAGFLASVRAISVPFPNGERAR